MSNERVGTTPLRYAKMNGLGNEIVVVDLRQSAKVLAAAEAAAIAAVPRTHFDQMMVLHAPRTPGTEAYVRIYNTDGSEAQACGNGTRCIGWLVSRATGRTALQFESVAGVLDVSVRSIDSTVVSVRCSVYHSCICGVCCIHRGIVSIAVGRKVRDLRFFSCGP